LKICQEEVERRENWKPLRNRLFPLDKKSIVETAISTKDEMQAENNNRPKRPREKRH
jgi:hypothetical protein